MWQRPCSASLQVRSLQQFLCAELGQPPGSASDVLDQPRVQIMAMQRLTCGTSGRCVVHAHSLLGLHRMTCLDIRSGYLCM